MFFARLFVYLYTAKLFADAHRQRGRSASVARTMSINNAAEVEERLTTHFATHDTLYRSEMESICECTRYRAVQFLETFVKEGKLRKAGRQNGRYYIPVEGCFGK